MSAKLLSLVKPKTKQQLKSEEDEYNHFLRLERLQAIDEERLSLLRSDKLWEQDYSNQLRLTEPDFNYELYEARRNAPYKRNYVRTASPKNPPQIIRPTVAIKLGRTFRPMPKNFIPIKTRHGMNKADRFKWIKQRLDNDHAKAVRLRKIQIIKAKYVK